ncbi:MAG: PQQ-binding-like beta-propeller repeat protein [Natrialbaceae archaeon]|nr:PQQ-binding-like beta-propeller repeat protein [Natrialbaceae archaeon]
MDATPAVHNGTVYVVKQGLQDNGLLALDADTGTELWNASAGGTAAHPTVVNGTVYVGAGGDLHAIDTATGALVWNVSTRSSVETAPAVVDNTVYFGSYNDDVYAVNASTGTEEWRYTTGSAIKSDPAVVGGTVYIGSDDDTLYALDADTGTLDWDFQAPSSIAASPAVADGQVYVPTVSSGTLFALDAWTGLEQWSHEMGDTAVSSPTVANNTVYVGSHTSNITALAASSGAVRWQYPLDDWVFASPTPVDGTIYVGTSNGTFYALSGRMLALENLSTNSPVTEGDPLVANVSITNTGDENTTETISLIVNGTERDSATVSLGSGEQTSVPLSWATGSGDAGTYTATVRTTEGATISDSIDVETEAPPPPPPPSPSGGSGGGPAGPSDQPLELTATEIADGEAVLTHTGIAADRTVEILLDIDGLGTGAPAVLRFTVTEATDLNMTFQLDEQPPTAETPTFERADGTEAHRYLVIDHAVPNSAVEDVSLEFQLDRSVLDPDEDPGDVAIYRHEPNAAGEAWAEQPTTVADQAGGQITYSTELDGLSAFVTGIKQAQFDITDASVSVSELQVGETTEIIVQITNTGAADGTFTAELLIDGEVEEQRDLTIAQNGTRQTTFERTFESAGSYEVLVNDVSTGEVSVAGPDDGGGGIGLTGIALGVVVLLAIGAGAYLARERGLLEDIGGD